MRSRQAFACLLALFLAFSLLPSYASAEESKEPYTFEMDVAPIIIDGRTYTPARYIAEAFGIYAQWDADTHSATLTRGLAKVVLTIGSKELAYDTDGETGMLQMDVAPMIRDGRTLVPVRYWAECFGLEVGWDESSRTATVSEGEKALTLSIGSKTLMLTGGHFLSPYEGFEAIRFFLRSDYVCDLMPVSNETYADINIYEATGTDLLCSLIFQYSRLEGLDPPVANLEDVAAVVQDPDAVTAQTKVMGIDALKLMPAESWENEYEEDYFLIYKGHLLIVRFLFQDQNPINKIISDVINTLTIVNTDGVLFSTESKSVNVLEFKDCDGNVLMTQDDILSASAEYGPTDNSGIAKHHLLLYLRDPDKFAEITKEIANKPEGDNYLSIHADGTQISAPFVDKSLASTGIAGDKAIITFGEGNAKDMAEKARHLASIINAAIENNP